MYNKINELKVSVYLNKDISYKDSYEEIATLVNYSMKASEYLSIIHKEKGFKHLCISGLYPIEIDKMYKEDCVYTFIIRSYKTEIINNLQKCLNNLNNDTFTVMLVEKVFYDKSNINYIDTLTPTIITKDNRCWDILSDNKEYFNNAIFNNLIKKYNDLQGINQHFNADDIISDIQIKNQYAIIINYKGIQFLGYKIRIYFKNNNIAQELANLSVAEGVGEKNSSFCQGFVKPYFRREVR